MIAPTTSSERWAFFYLVLLGAAIVALTLTTPFVFRTYGDTAYSAITIPTGLLVILALRVSTRAPVKLALALIVTIAVLLRLYLLFLDPLLSSDIYRYVWDGKVQAHGFNPYRFIPAAPELAYLRDTAIYPNINRADYAVTIYPPVAQMFFFLVTRFGETVTVMKAGFLACEAVTVTFIWLLLVRLGKHPGRMVAYLWHPLPMWEIADAGHVDALMVTLLMAGIWFAIRGRGAIGAFFVGMSGLAKPFSLPSLPAFWRPWDLKAPAAAIGAVVLCYLPYLTVGQGVLGFLTRGYLKEESFIGGERVWPLAAWRTLFGTASWDYGAYLAFCAVVMGILAYRAIGLKVDDPETMLADIKRLLLAFLLLLSPNYPWYFLALTPFVVLTEGATAWAVTLGVLLLQDELEWDFFIPVLTRKTAIYGVVFVAVIFDAWWARRTKARNSLKESTRLK